VAPHDLAQRGEVRWAAGRGVEDRSDLAEEVGAEDAGGDDRERPGVALAGVVEVVDGAAGDEERLARADLGRRALDRPGEDALEPVDRLPVAATFAPAGTSNSKIATDPADCSPSTRKRIVISPTLISSRVLVVILLLLSPSW
jgi:hypothetical protein